MTKKAGLFLVDPNGGVKARVVWDDDGALQVHDALAEKDGTLLLATDRGLRRLRPASPGETEDAKVPSRHVERIVRDGLGRLWLGGDGLSVRLPSGEVVGMETLPGVGTRHVNALVADPDRRTGVVAAFEGSVAFASLEP